MFKWTIFEIEQEGTILNSNGTASIKKKWEVVHTEPYDSTDDASIEEAFGKCLQWLKEKGKKGSKYVIQELYHV